MAQDRLNLRIRKPAPGTGMLTVPPGQVREVSSYVLLLACSLGRRLTEFVEA